MNRRKGIALALAALVAVTLLALSPYIVGTLLTMPIRGRFVAPESLKAEPIEFKTDGGLSLKGSWIHGKPNQPVIILLHGIRASRKVLVERAKMLAEYGYSVCMFDFRAHGESDGNQITFGFREAGDGNAAVAFVRAKAPESKIGMIGISMGGAAALLSDSSEQVDALVLESVYPTIEDALNNRTRHWLGRFAKYVDSRLLEQLQSRLQITKNQLRPIDRLKNRKKPVLILSGAEDYQTTYRDTKALYEAANEPKSLYMFADAGHVDLCRHDRVQYEAVVTKFFENNLRSK